MHSKLSAGPSKIKILIFFMLWCAGFSAQAQTLPKPFKATFDVYHGDTAVGQLTRTFRKTGSHQYHLEDNREIQWLLLGVTQSEKTSMLWKNQEWLPLHYQSYQNTLGKEKRSVIEFDWDSRQASGQKGDKTWSVPLPTLVHDKMSYQIAVQTDLLANKTALSYAVIDKGRIKTYEFKRVGEETIQTPLGRVQALKLVRYKKNQETINLWLVKAWGYAPARIEQSYDNEPYAKAVIRSIQFLR